MNVPHAFSRLIPARLRPSPRSGDVFERHNPPGLDLSHNTVLYLEDITVSFDGFRALNKLTLYVEAGELRCIIGPNGAGKTTMMDIITGKTRPDSGTVYSAAPSTCCATRRPTSPSWASAASSRSPPSSSTSPCSRTWSWR